MLDIDRLKNKISGKLKEYDIIDIWDILMQSYGWISYEDFLALDSSIVTKLIENIDERNKKENKKLNSKRMGR